MVERFSRWRWLQRNQCRDLILEPSQIDPAIDTLFQPLRSIPFQAQVSTRSLMLSQGFKHPRGFAASGRP